MALALGVGDPVRPRDRLARARALHGVFAVMLVAVSLASLGTGATGLGLAGILNGLTSGDALGQVDRVVLYDIRLPRLLTGIAVGAALAVSGAVLQGLFRNPLADPGIIGVSAGAGLGAITVIVLGGTMAFVPAGPYAVPVAAFLGAWGVTIGLYRVSTRGGRTSVATMLLAGIAVAALAGAFAGILIFTADDQQLRDLTFWNLGSLAGASWIKLAACAPAILLSIGAACTLGPALNALALGEATAAHVGYEVERVKTVAVLSVALGTGSAVAVAGGIGFVGIVVPHLLRLATGPDHRALLVNSALCGAALLVAADTVARVIVAPAELPIGILTAVIGAPVFLWILLRQRGLGA
ncbi:heme ABC transporter permease [Roseivivax halodurans JCM 10272]|uniref:Heme ABC transporter permease n=1 Tax=Roseivivax halodurans JCM 10272 TaxID=1449350 RepID=X7EJ96_9RHOB|nr:iron ABC transporter permease [Roseivivax halodurans]ETX15930.1 heme ABC transporter permease [Roseivivax halodurans JCM 10272]